MMKENKIGFYKQNKKREKYKQLLKNYQKYKQI